jgi:hypothetical protein
MNAEGQQRGGMVCCEACATASAPPLLGYARPSGYRPRRDSQPQPVALDVEDQCGVAECFRPLQFLGP